MNSRGVFNMSSNYEGPGRINQRVQDVLGEIYQGVYNTSDIIDITAPSTMVIDPRSLISNPDTSNPKDKVGSKKVNLSLIPPVANIYEARVMELGASKYGEKNWRDSPVRLSVYISASLRHFAALSDGQDIDHESGQPHIAHIRANTGILLDALEQGTLIDDRKTAGKAAEVLIKVEKK